MKEVSGLKKRWITSIAAAAMLLSCLQLPVSAQSIEKSNFSIEGNVVTKKSSEIYNVNPYNPQKVSGVGESGTLTITSGSETIQIPLASPLYKLSEAYADKIVCKDGVWGIERNVTRKVFDGSENWEILNTKKYQNANTTIFSLDLGEKLKIKEGISSHFDTFSDKDQRTNIYDGISVSTDGTKCYVRIMNVRNVKNVEDLKKYLETQKTNNNPVLFLYAAPKTSFEPFSEEIQGFFHRADLSRIGFMDKVAPKSVIKEEKEIQLSKGFNEKNTWRQNEDLKNFAQSVNTIKIYNAVEENQYWIESITINENINECVIKLATRPKQTPQEAALLETTAVNSTNETETTALPTPKSKITSIAVFSFFDCDFTSGKPTEILFESADENGTTAVIQIDFSKFKIPEKNIESLTYEEAGFDKNCFAQKELVLPEKIPVVEQTPMSIYYNNILLNGDIDKKDVVKAKEEINGENFKDRYELHVTNMQNPWKQEFILQNNENQKIAADSVQIIPVSKEVGKGVTKKVMFLGDSLINQNYFTQAVLEKFKEDDMKIELVGTRGTEENKHEGRGGWSAYDYCYEPVRYGVQNPFLNNGRFDFRYFMEKNQFENLDTVFISLGVNDLNQVGHNSHEEILKNFQTIVTSIRTYNPDIEIFFGMPTMLFSNDKTFMAKNTRMEFLKSLIKQFGNKEKEGIYLVPMYINIDPFMSFKFVEQIMTDDNPTQAMTVTDTTHPRPKGYEQMADITYSYLKYAESLEK